MSTQRLTGRCCAAATRAVQIDAAVKEEIYNKVVTISATYDAADAVAGVDLQYLLGIKTKPSVKALTLIVPASPQPVGGNTAVQTDTYRLAPPRRKCDAFCKRNGATVQVGDSLCVCCLVADDKGPRYTTCGTYL